MNVDQVQISQFSQSDERRKEVKKLVNAEELGRVVLWSSLYSLAAAIPYGHRYATSAVLYTGGVSFKWPWTVPVTLPVTLPVGPLFSATLLDPRESSPASGLRLLEQTPQPHSTATPHGHRKCCRQPSSSVAQPDVQHSRQDTHRGNVPHGLAIGWLKTWGTPCMYGTSQKKHTAEKVYGTESHRRLKIFQFQIN